MRIVALCLFAICIASGCGFSTAYTMDGTGKVSEMPVPQDISQVDSIVPLGGSEETYRFLMLRCAGAESESNERSRRLFGARLIFQMFGAALGTVSTILVSINEVHDGGSLPLDTRNNLLNARFPFVLAALRFDRMRAQGGRSMSRVTKLATVFVLAAPALAAAQVAPDATATGPNATVSSEYKLPAAIDADVLAGRTTELWARIYRPATLAAGPYPVVVFLHGNHATCGRGSNPRTDDRVDYTTSGTCPAGYVVAPSHAGYGYLADKLASWGYIVVSINANRGINAAGGVSGDSGLNLARGRLILKHLQKLSEWNKNGGTPTSIGAELKDRLDLSQVGLVGHSRGGEGVRAAYNLYRDGGSAWPARILSPLGIRVLFEIAPVDGQTSRVLNADGTTWSVLLPMCDGDVSNLQGIKPFDRMMRTPTESPARPKAAVAVWGTNHNFFNTEWQTSDSRSCINHTAIFPSSIGSPKQQTTAAHPVLALLRGNLGPSADPSFNQLFPSRFALPAGLTAITPVERSFHDSAAPAVGIVLDDFDKATGTSSAGAANESSAVTVTHGTAGNRHDTGQRAAAISWSSAGATTYFQSNFTSAGTGRDVSAYAFLNLRVARQSSTNNPTTPNTTNFKIQLVDATGSRSAPVSLSAHMKLTGPVGGPAGSHVLLQSAQIPLASFGTFDLTKLRGVRLVFDDTSKGAIYLANIRFSNSQIPVSTLVATGPTEDEMDGAAALFAAAAAAPAAPPRDAHFAGLRRVASSGSGNGQGEGDYELEIRSAEGFPVRNALAVLSLASQELTLSRYPDSGETTTLLFRVRAADLAAIPDGTDLSLRYDDGSRTAIQAGRLNKSLILQ